MTLRVVTWNCAMGFHRKAEQLLSLSPDLLILPECAAPEILRRKAPHFAFSDCEWSGDNKNKGLGVFSFGTLSLRRHFSWEPSFRAFVPVEVHGASTTMNLLSVWALSYRGPAAATMLEAIAHYRPFLSVHPAIVAGDFNSNVIWDTPERPRFAAVDTALRELGLASAYHSVTDSPLGKERTATLYFQRQVDQPYHIDYIYLPLPAATTARVMVGEPTDWLALSDHMPLAAEFDASAAELRERPRSLSHGEPEPRDQLAPERRLVG